MTTDDVSGRVQQRIRERLDGLLAAGASPGLQYSAVTRAGECSTHAVGLADVGTRTALTASTRLMAYSMSKTVTAAAVLKLAATGRLDLDDPAERYVDIPYGPAVTLRRLLSHTAGLGNPIPLRWVHLPPQHAAFDERAALRAVIASNPGLAAAPGTRFAYTNLGYWLLGAIVEACTQRPFTDYVERELLAPLGIRPLELGYSLEQADTASGYLEKWSWLNLLKRLVIDGAYIDRYEGSWLRIRAHYVDGPAFGGLIGTTAAFGTWLGDLLGESRTLPGAARAWLFEQQHLTSGEPVPMTLGWHIGELDGSRHYYKEGGGGGFHSMMRLYPERGFGSIIIGNATGFRAGNALDELDRLRF
jgi:CubicO group peptidase (beta-lactamase class C family)